MRDFTIRRGTKRVAALSVTILPQVRPQRQVRPSDMLFAVGEVAQGKQPYARSKGGLSYLSTVLGDTSAKSFLSKG